MFCVGLTGTIASGKSTATKIFAKLGAKIISADKIAKDITTENKDVFNLIVDKFGKGILDSENNLNRIKLREIIFQNKSSKLWLENLLHPLIRKKIEEELQKTTSKYCIIEIPLLTAINKKSFPYLDFVLLISASKEKQISRLVSRDNSSIEQAEKILSSQPSTKLYEEAANKILTNNSSIKNLKEQIIELDSLWKQSSKNANH